MLLKLVARFKDLRMHVLHSVPELHTEATENISLPSVILRIHARLYLLIVNNACTERALRLGCIECRSRLLDLRKQLLPVR